jgi:hypothetical protein
MGTTAEPICRKLSLQQYPGPNATNAPHQCLTSPTLLHGESAILIIQRPAHHAATAGYKCVQGMKESVSLIDRPALAAEEWTSVADYYTRIKEYCLNPIEVLESKGYQREMFPFSLLSMPMWKDMHCSAGA